MLQISRKWFEMGLKVSNNRNNSGPPQGTTKQSVQVEVNRQRVLVKWKLIKLISKLFPLHLFCFLPWASEQYMINEKVLSWSLIFYCKTTVKYKVKGKRHIITQSLHLSVCVSGREFAVTHNISADWKQGCPTAGSPWKPGASKCTTHSACVCLMATVFQAYLKLNCCVLMQQYESQSICQLTGSCIMKPIDRSPCEQQTHNMLRLDADASFSLQVEI